MPELEGIGYYEADPKVGIVGASLAGGTEIVIYGQGMSHTPSSITAIFSNQQMGANSGGPPKPQDVAFSSHTDGGKLKYTTPSIMQIHNASYEKFSEFNKIQYQLGLLDYDAMTQQVKNMKCEQTPQFCSITYHRDYTPILYYLQPPIIYSDSEMAFWLDPRRAQEMKSTKLPEFPWVEVRLNGFGVDFEGFIEEDTRLPTYTKSQVRGLMGAITPSKDVEINFRFRVGYAMHMDYSMIRCSYDNSTCYKAKAVARIDSIDENQGYTTGGQILTIKGHGFAGDAIDVQIDGVSCKVFENSREYIKCVTGANSNPSSDTTYVGQHGLRRKYFNTTTQLTRSNITSSTEFIETLALDLESPFNLKNGYSGNIYTGYFKAPATAGYRFYVSADDDAFIYFSSVSKSPSDKTLIFTSPGWSQYRDYFQGDGKRTTQWLNLTKDEYYYIEVHHIQYSGGDHISIAVEIEDRNIVPGHHHTMKEIQRLFINQDIVRETTTVTIEQLDDGQFTLGFVNPNNGETYTSSKMSTNCSQWDFYVAVNGFYWTTYWASINVKKTMYDPDGVVTTDDQNAAKVVFTIQVEKSLNKPSTTQIKVQQISTASTITVALPEEVQLSNPEMSGAFQIKCALDKEGTLWNNTVDIQTSSGVNNIRDKIIQACPLYREKFSINEGPLYSSTSDGRDLMLRFIGLNYDVPQMEVINSVDLPVLGNNPNLNSTTFLPYDTSRVFYEPVPFEFLYTEESTAQVIITVNGIEAVCHSLNCGYTYFEPTPKITGFTLDGSTLTMTGTGLPATIQSVKFSNIECSDILLSGTTTLTCQVVPVAGSWIPEVTDLNGLIPVDASPLSVPLTVTSVSPLASLNPFGGSIFTVYGTGFPQSLGNNEATISFSDDTQCELVSVSSTIMRCVTGKFSALSTAKDVIVTVNGVSDSSQSVNVRTDPSKVSKIEPSTVSPVLKTLLKLTVSGYLETLDKNDLEVSVTHSEDSSIVRKINIVEVGIEGDDQFIKVKFGGSESGVYNLKVRSRSYGSFDTTGITLTLIGTVTDFEPKRGSIHGGTLVKITGYNFSTDIQDNPVKMGYTDCMVEASSAFEIQCRTLARHEDEVGTDDLIVFLKTYEEATCQVEGGCTFVWEDVAKITDYSVAYDQTVNQYVLSIIGEGLGATTENTEVFIDELEQEIFEASETALKVKIVDILDSTTLNTKIYLPTGLPNLDNTLLPTKGITLTPRLNGISPNIGSLGGSLIVADVRGIGLNTQGVTLITSNSVDICESVTIPHYGQVLCHTKDGLAIPQGGLKLKVGDKTFICQASDTTACNYQTSDTLIVVTSALLTTKSTIKFTGSGFQSFSGEFTAKAKFLEVVADSVVVNSDTEAVATFTNGLPLTSQALRPYLYFENQSIQHYALSPSVTLANPATVTSLDQAISCSFAGGCKISISQPGLLTNLQSDSSKNTIRVCGQLCKVVPEESTGAVTKCSVPALATTYSIDKFKIVSESYLMGVAFSSNADQTMTVWDGSHQNGWTDNAENCYFGTAFRAGYVGVLNEVKYFMSRFNKDNFVSQLRFEGSSDGKTWTTIFVVSEEIHEGWNYYNYAAGKELKYRYYRFFGPVPGSCLVGEVSLRGYEVIDSTTPTQTCSAQITLNGEKPIVLTGDIVYKNTLTPLLKSITPRFGNVVGGEIVTFDGENFSSNIPDYSILLDGKSCAVTFASATQIKCKTSKRPGLYPTPTMQIKIGSMGLVSTQGLVFRYVNYWSEPSTWGGEFAPIEGDLIYIPKGLHLLVDVDSTPVLSAVVVEGSLIFPSNADPNHVRTFDAHYVMVRGGLLEVGTEQFPYTSKLVITMHSNRTSPELPIFGNKVIAMYNGILDLHGVPRNPTWTELDVTAEIGATQITLVREVDWKVGERIVVAPTGYHNTEAEERTILEIDRTNPSKPKIKIDAPFEFRHYAGIQKFGPGGRDWIETRAEVGLLTRNVLYRGEPVFSANNEYGAQIMVHSNGMETLTARIEYIELFNVGQAFQLGRYPIHFHLIGVVHNSYIKGNAIHQSYNRACTIHGVHYLRLIENVAYNIKGHTFFIEDAAETKNYLEKNLAILTKKSWSLLNSDQTPASFWITHPDNIFKGNHAAGADNYGYWFDTKPNPTGPSFDPNICPENSPLGEFSNNVAHSNGRYGLRIFHKLIPRKFPCQPIIEDPNNATDPFWKNPIIPAVFTNFTGYKNQRNGAIALDIGAVRFENFKVADNLLAGIEVEMSHAAVRDGYARTDNALIIGYSELAEDMTFEFDSYGFIGPRSENYHAYNLKFYNFDKSDKVPLGTCSHCPPFPSTDSGGRTLTVKGLYFDPATNPMKLRFQDPKREIVLDLDGSLTGKGPNSWATSYWRHNLQPECVVNMQVYDGLLCSSAIQVRRIVYYNYQPDTLAMMDMKILQIDDSIVKGMDEAALLDYKKDISKYSIVPFRERADPGNAWAIPFITGHKYNIHWQYGIDFEKMQIDLSPRWKTTDKDLYIVHNFTDVRAKVDFVVSDHGANSDKVLNQTLLTSSVRQTGANIIYNDTSVREIHYIINGKNQTRNQLVMTGFRCDGSCLASVAQVEIETTVRLWSDPSTWESGQVPLAGEDAQVLPGRNVLFDLESSPIYRYVEINGRVTFKQDAPKLHLRAKYIFVRMGELLIGSEAEPYLGDAQITLYGKKSEQNVVYSNAIEAGNKLIANTALISLWGKNRLTRTRLLKTALAQDTVIQVEPGLDWQTNDKIALPSTTMKWYERDFTTVKTYDTATGTLTLQEPLNNYHWGAPESTSSSYSGVDMRGEVVLMTRNIKIVGDDTDGWGCNIVTSDFTEENLEIRVGRTYMDFVEIYNCSQMDTFKAALRFENSKLGWSKISNSAIHNGLGTGIEIKFAWNVTIKDNNIYGFKKFGINIVTSSNITIDGNNVFAIYSRKIGGVKGDPVAGIAGCGHIEGDKCAMISIINNLVGSVENSFVDTTGYVVQHHPCGKSATQNTFRNNVAHSVHGYGAIIFKDATERNGEDCIEASYFKAYKNTLAGVATNQATNNLMLRDMVLIDNGYSVIAQIGLDGDKLSIKLKNVKFYGDVENGATECPGEANICQTQPRHPSCFPKTALMAPCYTGNPKPPLIDLYISAPQFNIMADALFGGEGINVFENVEFINFKSNVTTCGMQQKLIQLNELQADYFPPMQFINTRFENVHERAVTYLAPPPPGWAIIDDCGQFPCTGPNNVLMQFTKSTFAGLITPKGLESDFQIISNLAENSGKFDFCQLKEDWNAYYCTNDKLAMITFESFDQDKLTRLVTPITITNEKLGSRNVLNTFMDHLWDGFYTSLKRLARFPAIIQTGNGLLYEINYKSIPPLRQRFSLRASSYPVTFRLKYGKAGAYIIKDGKGVEIKANAWDNSIQAPGPIKGDAGGYCGENRYVGVVNILEFYMTKDCIINIEPIDSIQSSVRMNWTMSEFFKDGGTTKFVDRIAASLGVKVANVKVVSVYEGSVVVDFQVVEDSQKTLASKGGIDKIQTSLTTQLTSKSLNLGAPILNVQISSTKSTATTATTSSSIIVTSTNTTTVKVVDQLNPTVEVDTTAVFKPTIGGSKNPPLVAPIVYKNKTLSIVKQEEGRMTVIYSVVGTIIALSLAASVLAWYLYRRYRLKLMIKAKPDVQVKVKEEPDEDSYEDQYHPRGLDFIDIFGRRENFDKVNQADEVIQEAEVEATSPRSGEVIDSVRKSNDHLADTNRDLLKTYLQIYYPSKVDPAPEVVGDDMEVQKQPTQRSLKIEKLEDVGPPPSNVSIDEELGIINKEEANISPEPQALEKSFDQELIIKKEGGDDIDN